ncbi:MAG: hypothetical protein U0610_31250 [bacterium]
MTRAADAQPKPHRYPVRYQASDGLDVEAEAEQLTDKGVFVHTQAASPVNSLITLQLTLPGMKGPPIRATASVVYSNPYRPFVPSALPPGMGLKFTLLAELDRQRIFDFVNALTSGNQDLIKVDAGKRPHRRIAPAVEAPPPLDALNAAAEAAMGNAGGRGKERNKAEAPARPGRGKSRERESADSADGAPESLFARLWKKLNQPVGGTATKPAPGKSAPAGAKAKRPKGKS